jgi:hypothetical protein
VCKEVRMNQSRTEEVTEADVQLTREVLYQNYVMYKISTSFPVLQSLKTNVAQQFVTGLQHEVKVSCTVSRLESYASPLSNPLS